MDLGSRFDREKLRYWMPRIAPYVGLALAALLVADLLILAVRDNLLPAPSESLPPARRRFAAPLPSKESYSTIVDRNIFNPDQSIPDAFGEGSEYDEDRAVPTNLPIELVATIVHLDPAASIAILKLKNSPDPIVMKVGEEIESMAEIVGIKRGRVYFVVRANRRLEYAELPVDQPIPLGEFSVGAVAPGITRQEGGFTIEKSTLDAQTANLSTLLQQARAVPQLGPNGQMEGFRIDFIQQGSLFEKLGMKQGDVIRGVNGQRLDNPSKAIELYNTLKSESSIEIEIERGGKSETMTYNVR